MSARRAARSATVAQTAPAARLGGGSRARILRVCVTCKAPAPPGSGPWCPACRRAEVATVVPITGPTNHADDDP